MLKRIFAVLFFTSIVACSKEEPPPPVTPQTTTPSAAPAPAPAPETSQPPSSGNAASPAPATPTPPPAASGSGATTAGASGEQIYKQTCSVCHITGVAGAPKLEDKPNWAPRIAQGKDTLYTHAIKGFQGKVGMMPPKGGNVSLTDEQVKSAVDYMVSKAK